MWPCARLRHPCRAGWGKLHAASAAPLVVLAERRAAALAALGAPLVVLAERRAAALAALSALLAVLAHRRAAALVTMVTILAVLGGPNEWHDLKQQTEQSLVRSHVEPV